MVLVVIMLATNGEEWTIETKAVMTEEGKANLQRIVAT
jgi:hypothetical protein